MGPELKDLVTSPIGMGDLPTANAVADGENPVCGDRLRLQLELGEGRIEGVAFRATACPACIAVASCAVQVLRHRPVPAGPPFAALRDEVARRGGLGRFEGHALELVEDVLGRALAVCRGLPS